MLHRWIEKWNGKRAVIFSSLAFGLLHADVIGAAFFGIVMSLLYLKTKSLVLPIACHALNNGLMELFGIVNLMSDEPTKPYTLEQFRADFHIGALCLLFSAPILFYFIFKNRAAIDSMPPYYEQDILKEHEDLQGTI